MSDTPRLVVIGCGAHSREVAEVARAVAEFDPSAPAVLGIVADREYASVGDLVGEAPVLGDFDWLAANDGLTAVGGVGDPAERLALVERARQAGATFATLVHPTAVVGGRVRFDEGVVVASGCHFTADVHLEAHVHVNVACTFNHDVVVGRGTYVAPGATLCGRVTVGERVWIGAGCTVIQGVTIGDDAVIGAGAVVIRDVQPGAKVVGVPARPLS